MTEIPKPEKRGPKPRRPIARRTRPRKTAKRKGLTKTADKLFSILVRSAGTCWARGDGIACGGPLQCAHVVSRRYRAVRWRVANARCLCRDHHFFYTHHPIEWERLIAFRAAGWEVLNALKHEALRGAKPDMLAVIERLRVLSIEQGK